MTVHQRPERPDLVMPRKSHLPFEQLIDRLSLREVEFLDLLSVGSDGGRRDASDARSLRAAPRCDDLHLQEFPTKLLDGLRSDLDDALDLGRVTRLKILDLVCW